MSAGPNAESVPRRFPFVVRVWNIDTATSEWEQLASADELVEVVDAAWEQIPGFDLDDDSPIRTVVVIPQDRDDDEVGY